MKLILKYIQQYFYETDKRLLLFVSLLVATMIFLNYNYKVDNSISAQHQFLLSFAARYSIFTIAFILPYFFTYLLRQKTNKPTPLFISLLFIAPAVFALKMALDIPIHFTNDVIWNVYWNDIFYWPLRLLITGVLLFIIWKMFDRSQPFYGLVTGKLKLKPYLIMLLIMLPLIAAASTQPDFLVMYPKLKTVASVYFGNDLRVWHKLLFELSYGSDFIGIELFFRGFLVLAFIKWAGKDAILPMACFYCTIHFGKPLGECISSYFGGMILGIVVYHTRSIVGGLIVHLGIAWMMEIGGYIGNSM